MNIRKHERETPWKFPTLQDQANFLWRLPQQAETKATNFSHQPRAGRWAELKIVAIGGCVIFFCLLCNFLTVTLYKYFKDKDKSEVLSGNSWQGKHISGQKRPEMYIRGVHISMGKIQNGFLKKHIIFPGCNLFPENKYVRVEHFDPRKWEFWIFSVSMGISMGKWPKK